MKWLIIAATIFCLECTSSGTRYKDYINNQRDSSYKAFKDEIERELNEPLREGKWTIPVEEGDYESLYEEYKRRGKEKESR